VSKRVRSAAEPAASTEDGSLESGFSDRLASVASELFSPYLVVLAALLAVALHSTTPMRALAYWLAAGLIGVAVPMGFVIGLVRKGRLSSYHVPVRRQRPMLMLAAIVPIAVGAGLLVATHAPRVLITTYSAGLVLLALTTVITRWWKISMHASVCAGGLTACLLVYGAVVVTGMPALLLVSWSRIKLGQHSPAQVAGGIALGVLTAIGVFAITGQRLGL
jgi:membrane-associated phospholipid phosphatase